MEKGGRERDHIMTQEGRNIEGKKKKKNECVSVVLQFSQRYRLSGDPV